MTVELAYIILKYDSYDIYLDTKSLIMRVINTATPSERV